MKRLTTSFILGTCLLLLSCAGFNHMASYAIIKPVRCADEKSREYFARGIHPQEYGLAFQNFDVLVRDSVSLKGWYIRSKSEHPAGTVLVLHGMSSCKEHMIASAEMFGEAGYNTVLFDLPAHGKSGGIYTTFGYFERRDISVLIDTLQSQFALAEPLAIYGNSLGGAIALQVLAADQRFCCGIIESTFARLDEVVYDYINGAFRPATRGMIRNALEKAGRIAAFPPDSVNPELSARSIGQPVLLIHGDADEHISVEYGRRIFANLASAEKEWFEIPGGNHYNLWTVGGAAYKMRFLDFLAEKMAEAAVTGNTDGDESDEGRPQ